tara:strand:+ start:3444 stop:4082 length:639 start_codon:yes stop_codon:yes gene_type:complete
MKLLELFSGTQSIGKVAKTKGYKVISLDINDYNGKYIPTHKVDILDFDYKKYPQDYFDIIWASPPCVHYSRLQYSWLGRKKKINGDLVTFTREMLERNMDISDKWVLKVFEIIDYFNPRSWFIENPESSNLKNRHFMKDKPYYDVDYCRYCDWGYRKRTRIWTNKKDFCPKKCNYKCGNLIQGTRRHKAEIGNDILGLDRYRIPPNLLNELF